MSIEEASQEQAAKKAKVDKCVAIASRLGWTDVEKGRECFVMKEKDGMKQWGSIFMPRNKTDADGKIVEIAIDRNGFRFGGLHVKQRMDQNVTENYLLL